MFHDIEMDLKGSQEHIIQKLLGKSPEYTIMATHIVDMIELCIQWLERLDLKEE